MLARVAFLTYWTARYLERAENNARILDVNAQLALDVQRAGRSDDPALWEPVVFTCGGDKLFKELHGTATERNVENFVLFERANPSSVRSCVAQARENARCIREQISSEMWEQLNELHLWLRDSDFDRLQAGAISEMLGRIKVLIQGFYGITESMYPRNENWHWLQLGRHVERADNVSRLIDVKYFTLLPKASLVGGAFDIVQWAAVLRSCSAFEAYRRTRQGALTLESVLDFLIREKGFPRSILHSINEARTALAGIAGTDPDAPTPFDAIRDELLATTPKAILAGGLHEFLDRVQIALSEAHSEIVATYIDYPV